MRRTVLVVLLTSILGLVACGKEKGRVRFTNEGAADASFDLAKGDVAFWTDLDVKYDGDAALAYDVELVQGGATVAKASCNPLGNLSVKTSWVETNMGSSHARRGMGKMDCAATLANGGPTTVKVKLAYAKKPANVTLKSADLVVKQ